MLDVVWPVDQVKLLPPDAVRVVVPPATTVSVPPMVATGGVPTVTLMVTSRGQVLPPSLTVKKSGYVLLAVGLVTVKVLVA